MPWATYGFSTTPTASPVYVAAWSAIGRAVVAEQPASKFEAVMSCAELGGRVTEVGLAYGATVVGDGALRLLAAAIDALRRGREGERAEAERRYREFVRRKKGRKESKARREALVDLCCSAASAVVVLTILAAVALR